VQYYNATRTLLEQVNCCNDIDAYYDMILAALHNAARSCVPVTKVSFFKHYWDDELNGLKYRSVEANQWIDCGRPRSGLVYR